MSGLLIAPPEPEAPQGDPLVVALDPVRVVACPRVFTTRDRVIFSLPQGLRLRDILLEAGIVPDAHVRVWIDDWLIPRDMWHVVRPRAGRVVTVRVIPAGGNAGKTIARIAIVLAAVVIGAVIGNVVGGVIGGTLAGLSAAAIGTAVGAGVGSVVGNLIANALVPIPEPNLDALTADAPPGSSPTYSLAGARNRMAVYGKVPRVYGRHRIVPPYAAEPYTSLEGHDQYLHCLFALGYGPLSISDPRIGAEPLSSYQGVTTLVLNPWDGGTWPGGVFSPDIHEEQLSLPLEGFGVLVRHIPTGVSKVSVDLTWPRGAFGFNPSTGKYTPAPVVTDFWFREQGTTTWIDAASDTVGTEPVTTTIRKTYFSWDLDPAKSYEVMVSRSMPRYPEPIDSGQNQFVDDIFWTALRWERWRTPVSMTGVTLYALKIKATEQLNGIIDTFNVEVTGQMLRPVGFSWVFEPTNNPAAAFRNVLQGSATRTPVPDAKINLDALAEWGEFCWAQGFTYNAVIDYDVTVAQLLRDIAAAGLASPTVDAQGRYSVVRDIQQPSPVQLFTPRNSWGFSGSKAFPDKPHGFKVRYVDGLGTWNPAFPQPADAPSWEIDEQIVYAEGYGQGNATRFESLEFRGVTSFHHAASLARYHLAVTELRPEVWSLNADIENLVCTRGDRVQVAHDVLLGGLGWGRVTSVTLDGGGAMTALVLDEEVFTEIGKSYVLRVRHSTTGTQVTAAIVATGTVTQTVTFVTPQSGTFAAPGNLVAWGESGQETLSALVRTIEPGPDLTARLTLVPYHDAIYAWNAPPLPGFNPQISRGGVRPPWKRPGPPAPPHIEAVQADETTILFGPGGAPMLRILAFVNYIAQPGAPDQAPEFVLLEGQIVESFSDESLNPWRSIPLVLGSARSLTFGDVQAGQLYDIRVRAVAGQMVSPWSRRDGVYVTGRTTRPPDVTTFLLEGGATSSLASRVGNAALLRWAYPTPQIDHAGFLLRRHFGTRTIWADAQPLHDGILPPAQAFWHVVYFGEPTTYLLKAVNTSGLESVNAAVVQVDLGDRDVPNLIFTEDYEAAGYPGTIVGGAVVGSDIEAFATSPTVFWSGGPPAPFWQGPDSTAFWVAQYTALSYVWNLLPDDTQVPCTISLETAIMGQAVAIEYRPSGTELFWSASGATAFWTADADPFWSATVAAGWLPWPGLINDATHQVYEWRITCAAGPVQGDIQSVKVLIDVPDVFEYFEDVSIASGTGTRLPITKQYRAIVIVNNSLQQDGGNAVRVSVEDKGTGGPPYLTDGPLLKAWNSGGVSTSALVDAWVRGY